jgi:DNA-binding protein HU-beta
MYVGKSELIREIARKTDLSQRNVEEALNAFVSVVREVTAQDGTVRIAGFGTFKAPYKPAREVRNPATGGTVTKPGGRKLLFKAPAK